MTWRGDLPAACWEAGEELRIIPVEAESTSDGVFLATHTSIPLIQRDHVASATGGSPSTEHDLLRAVREQPADQPIIPILGKPGTGKSHLVRWLRINLETTDATRLIFVPKHRMSLRGILDLILEHATGERADELRAKVATAVDAASDEKEARLRLRAALAILVETRGTQQDGGTPEDDELRAYLASPEGLPALLLDPVFRDRLLSDEGPIGRLVREKLSGKGTEDKEEAFGFSPQDLNLSVDDINNAGVNARDVAGALTSEAGLRDLAAKILNEQLGPAVSEVFGIGGDDLKQLLVELRLDLQRQGLELLLLIEDFSIFQGIQGGLIDAITLIPTENLQLCPMRVVMAVTTGYFVNNIPDTVYSRTYKVYDLETSQTGAATFEPAQFAARYLNAVRAGSALIDQHHDEGARIPKPCLQCPVHEKCHQAFGHVDDMGLFPFNRRALDLAIRSRSQDEGFIARDVLTRVLRPVLQRDHSEIDESRFPGAGFENDFRSGALDILDNIEDQVRLRTPGDPDMSERRIRMVRFWGPGNGPQNLDPTIHDAFGIPLLEAFGNAPEPAPPTTHQKKEHPPRKIEEQPSQPPTPPPATPEAKPRLVQAVDRWRASGDLTQGERNDLRNIVHAAIIGYLEFENGFGPEAGWTSGKKEHAPSFDASSSIVLDDDKLDKALIPVDRTNDEDVRVLRALAWAGGKGSWDAVPNGEVLQRLCMAKAQAWAARVTAYLDLQDRNDDPELARIAHALLTVSKAFGIADAYKPDEHSRIRALFASRPEATGVQLRPRLRKWQDAFSGSSQQPGREWLQDRLLRLASYSQGSGKPLAVDLPRLLHAVRDGAADAAWPAQAPDILIQAVRNIDTRAAELDQLLEEASGLLPDTGELGSSVAEVAKPLNSLIAHRAALGQLPSSINAEGLATAARAVKSGDQKKVEAIGEALQSWRTLPADERLRLMTSDWDNSAKRIETWLSMAGNAVEALEKKLTAGPVSEVQREHDDALRRLSAGLNALSDEITHVARPGGNA
ncbi:protein DpdH [Streptomyces sp. NPDC004237]|uniref:protein DpdH n=1 Tax=Streptomyces sp. NPDC004237 TaxID=3154455 RepID=UPI0033A92D13